MGITLPILILALPFFMFLLLGIGGVKMSRKVAGILGILGMGDVVELSVWGFRVGRAQREHRQFSEIRTAPF